MSSLRELYQEVILDHGKAPRNYGHLADATGESHGHNPLCGDTVTIYLRTRGGVVEDIEEKVAEAHGVRPARIEGREDLRWVLMDYGDWVAHVFLDEARAFYDLERLWADVPKLAWS